MVEVSGSVATTSFEDSDDKVTLRLGPRQPATLAFADGASLSVAPESATAWKPFAKTA